MVGLKGLGIFSEELEPFWKSNKKVLKWLLHLDCLVGFLERSRSRARAREKHYQTDSY
jgi:hypothetical protein